MAVDLAPGAPEQPGQMGPGPDGPEHQEAIKDQRFPPEIIVEQPGKAQAAEIQPQENPGQDGQSPSAGQGSPRGPKGSAPNHQEKEGPEKKGHLVHHTSFYSVVARIAQKCRRPAP